MMQLLPASKAAATCTERADRRSLKVCFDPLRPRLSGVDVGPLDQELMRCFAAYLQAGGLMQSVFRVAVACTEARVSDSLPNVSGVYDMREDGVRFTPHFPFECGLSYRSSFDPRPLGGPESSGLLTLEFSIPRAPDASGAEVTHIYPSGECLPENLLRFYVHFSKPMQRGRAETEISLLGPNGDPEPDALYRAPVELWDRSMQRLTILLDPGRLKRGLGPNRQLGPPLQAGQSYALVVGAGLTDLSGKNLSDTVYKRFRVTNAVRDAISADQWQLELPKVGSCQPFRLLFPMPLDRALLCHCIIVASASDEEQAIDGQIVVDHCEARWSLTPKSPWAGGSYRVRVTPELEDVCGNSLCAEFDRRIGFGKSLVPEAVTRTIDFHLA